MANKIRTKLLLFIDQEIQSKIKQKKLFYNLQNEEQKNIILYPHTDEIYSQHQNTHFVSFSNFEEKTSKNDIKLKKIRRNSRQSISTCLATPINKDVSFKSRESKNISVCYGNSICKKNFYNYTLAYNNIINIKKNCYSIKKVLKPSSTFQIYKKPKTDRKYLKNLCNSFKIIKKNDFPFNKQMKSRLSSVISKFNRRESAPIKKTEKKRSSIRASANNIFKC